jgi:hypothetical protein
MADRNRLWMKGYADRGGKNGTGQSEQLLAGTQSRHEPLSSSVLNER